LSDLKSQTAKKSRFAHRLTNPFENLKGVFTHVAQLTLRKFVENKNSAGRPVSRPKLINFLSFLSPGHHFHTLAQFSTAVAASVCEVEVVNIGAQNTQQDQSNERPQENDAQNNEAQNIF